MESDELLLFSTDYPHWQFDGDAVLPEGLSRELVRKIMIDNPRETYARLMETVAMNVQVTSRPDDPAGRRASKLAIADGDIHPQRNSDKDLFPYLEQRWLEHGEDLRLAAAAGVSGRAGLSEGPAERLAPRRLAAEAAARAAAWRSCRSSCWTRTTSSSAS